MIITPTYSELILFLTATVTLNLIPGTDVLYIASQSMISKRHGIHATLGISTGIGIYVLLTTVGLAEILQRSPSIFNAIKLIGAVYLLYFAWLTLNKSEVALVVPNSRASYSSYYKGIYTTLLNPKVGLFFITFLPQFVNPNQGKIGLQLLTLGIIFIISGTIINLIYAFLFNYLRSNLFSKLPMQKWLNKITAFILCVIAFKIITAKQPI